MFAEKEQQGGVGCDDGHGDSAVHAFRALDLLDGARSSDWSHFSSQVADVDSSFNFGDDSSSRPAPLFSPPIEVLSERDSEEEVCDHSPGSIHPTSEGVSDFELVRASEPVTVPASNVTISPSEWDLVIAGDFAQYRQEHSSLKFPWEEGILATIFDGKDDLDLPECQGFITAPVAGAHETVPAGVDAGPSASLGDAKYIKAVQNLRT